MTEQPITQATTVPEDASALNLTSVTACSFVDADGKPIGEALDGYMEITVHPQMGPMMNIYATKDPT